MFFFLWLIAFIQNHDKPACIHCIHYKPYKYDFESSFSTCKKFGSKDLHTGVIIQDYADSCRNNEAKCGKKGMYFKPEPNLCYKKIIHGIVNPYSLLSILL